MNALHPLSRRKCLLAAGAGLAALPLPAALRGEEPAAPQPVNDWLRQAVAEAPLALQFPGGTADECRAWQAAFRAKLHALLGSPAPPREWKTVTLETAELDDHRRESLLLVAAGLPPLPVYLLIPKPSGRHPAALALHGHGAHGHHPVAGRDDLPGVDRAIENAGYDYGRQLVRRGFVVAAPCFTPFGVRLGKAESFGKADPCSDVFLRMQALGKVLMGENLRDALWALELLRRRDDVDESRLACVGLSYGGRMTMLTAAMEPRIRVAVPSGALNVMQERLAGPYSCGAQIIPGLLQYGDVPEIASLIAPRPCLWEVGSEDRLIKPDWAERALARQRRAYQAFKAEERLAVARFEGGHRWNGVEAYRLLEKELS